VIAMRGDERPPAIVRYVHLAAELASLHGESSDPRHFWSTKL